MGVSGIYVVSASLFVKVINSAPKAPIKVLAYVFVKKLDRQLSFVGTKVQTFVIGNGSLMNFAVMVYIYFAPGDSYAGTGP
jgi:putative solute:sodium symporter small subunit